MPIETPARMICNVPVWGETYTHLFLSVALPSFLASGNLPALKTPAIFQIYTTPQDAESIKTNALYQKLKTLMPVEIHFITEHLDNPIPYAAMTHCHKRATEAADNVNGALLFLHPDCILAKGSLRFAEDQILKGKRVVSVTGIRLALEKAIPRLAPYYSQYSNHKNNTKNNTHTTHTLLEIQPVDLVKIALSVPHPITLKQFWEERKTKAIVPYNLFWKVGKENGDENKNGEEKEKREGKESGEGEEGWLGRCLALHPLMVFPRIKYAHFEYSVDQDYVINACPDFSEHYIATQSEDLFMCELTTESRNVSGYVNCSIDNLAEFAVNRSNGLMHYYARFPIRLHCGNQTEALWQAAEKKADDLIKQLYCRMASYPFYYQTN